VSERVRWLDLLVVCRIVCHARHVSKLIKISKQVINAVPVGSKDGGRGWRVVRGGRVRDAVVVTSLVSECKYGSGVWWLVLGE
jgi:hypothetical protein